MSNSEERWRRPGIRLAIIVLIGVAVYFLAIFVQQSLNLVRLNRELNLQEERVQVLRQENSGLKQRLDSYLSDEGHRLLVKKNLSYKDPGERVVIAVASASESLAPSPADQVVTGPSPEELAALPSWQQWVRVIFPPAQP
jgi:hypothetical protein